MKQNFLFKAMQKEEESEERRERVRKQQTNSRKKNSIANLHREMFIELV